MQVAPRLELKQRQQLVMTPQLQQAIRLLQMSHLEIASFIAEEAEKNPLLRVQDDGGEAAARPEVAPHEDVDSAIAREDHGAAEALLGERSENLYESAGPGGDGAISGFGRGRNGALADAGFAPDFEDIAVGAPTLREHLLPQIAASAAPRAVRLLASLLVDDLDEGGYLRRDLEELRVSLSVSSGLMQAAVALLQTCEPTGVGARDLRECLELQLRERNRFDPAMAAMLVHLEDLAAARLDRLRAVCGVDDEDLAEMIAEIRALDPRPAGVFTVGVAQTVTPDVLIRRAAHGGWAIEVNPDAMPKVLLDHAYLNRISASGDIDPAGFLASCRQSADWLIRALDQRAQTILKVATAIVSRQTGFLASGVAALTPLTLKAIAEEVGVHESTVSRVTTNKFLSCERGVFEMRFFFSQGLPASGGGEAVSAASVRHQIKALIENEKQGSVLSDGRIVTLLKQNGVDIARRTVAKYRETMNIPSSAQRKRMKAAALGR